MSALVPQHAPHRLALGQLSTRQTIAQHLAGSVVLLKEGTYLLSCHTMSLREQFGNIDIYLFDQLLKGSFTPGMSLLDAGCGGGRNLVYFLRHDFEVFAVDTNPPAIQQVQVLAANLAPQLPAQNFQLADVADLPFANAQFDLVVSSAVLHFARDAQHFGQMLDEMWRVLKPGGMLFARLASSIGIEERIQPVGNGWFSLPDGSERFLVDEAMLSAAMERLGATPLEPLKTTNVANLRCMTTWVLGKFPLRRI